MVQIESLKVKNYLVYYIHIDGRCVTCDLGNLNFLIEIKLLNNKISHIT